MEDIFQVGETYDWKILSIEPKAHRMGLLSIKDGGKKKKASEEKEEK